MELKYETRHVDDLGRISIPKDLRKIANINYGDVLDIAVINGVVIMSKRNVNEEDEDDE